MENKNIGRVGSRGSGEVRVERTPEQEKRGLLSKPFVVTRLQPVFTGPRRGGSVSPQPLFGPAPPVLQGDRQRMPVALEKIFDHLPLQNVLERLRSDFSGNQTLFQNSNGGGIQMTPEFSVHEVHASRPLPFKKLSKSSFKK